MCLLYVQCFREKKEGDVVHFLEPGSYCFFQGEGGLGFLSFLSTYSIASKKEGGGGNFAIGWPL